MQPKKLLPFHLKIICLALVLFCSTKNYASDFSLMGQFGTWSFSTKNIVNSETEKSGFGAYSLGFGMAIYRSVQAYTSINILMSEGFFGSQAFGFDTGINYFPFTRPLPTETESFCCKISKTELWRPYIGFFFSQRTFNFTLSTTYIGAGTYIGLNYQYSKSWFFNGEGRYNLFFGPEDAQATQINFMIGIGYAY